MKKRVAGILQELGLSSFAKRNVNELSLGKNSWCSGRGLVMKPSYLVFDEPTTMLDPKNKARFFEIIMRLKRTLGILLVTNILDDLRCTDRVLVLHKGRIIFDGEYTFSSCAEEGETLCIASLVSTTPHTLLYIGWIAG